MSWFSKWLKRHQTEVTVMGLTWALGGGPPRTLRSFGDLAFELLQQSTREELQKRVLRRMNGSLNADQVAAVRQAVNLTLDELAHKIK